MAKVSGLEGVELDYWVARALGYTVAGTQAYYGYTRWRTPKNETLCYAFIPSQTWTQGGPIINRECISVYASTDWTSETKCELLHWCAVHEPTFKRRGWMGDTPLVAAMRAFVASKYGDETPEEHHDNQD